jgi:DNA-binding XRE family transcriptional regulator
MDSVLRKQNSLGYGFRKTSATFGFRKRRRRGLGRNPPLAPSVFFWRNSGRTCPMCIILHSCNTMQVFILYQYGIRKKLGENLRKLRLKKNLSQGDLATALEVDRAYISNIENGRMNPTLSTLEKIANALGFPVANF